ncbi:unnamed protein product [Arabidopsis lyrata]|nr:unnamed protein product [Arabidopsis lyrata]
MWSGGSLGEEKQATFAYLPSISGNVIKRPTLQRETAASARFVTKGLRFITPKAFSELLKLSREYQMLTVTKVTDFRWTRSQRVQSKSVTSLRTLLLTCYIPAFLHGSRATPPCFSLPPPPPYRPKLRGRMEYSQVVRHRFLVPACKGSNPFTPDYEHPIGSVKNELTTEALIN